MQPIDSPSWLPSLFDLTFIQQGLHSGEMPATKVDDYDIAVRQLAFEIKGKVSK